MRWRFPTCRRSSPPFVARRRHPEELGPEPLEMALRAALREQIARLEAATGWNAQVEAMSRAACKAQLWNILREHLADDPALIQAVSELERLDEVSPSFFPSSGWMWRIGSERLPFS